MLQMDREMLNNACRVLMFLFCFLLGSCVTLFPNPPPGIHPELQEYVDRFEEYARKYYGESYSIPHMDIGFGDTSHFSEILHGPGYVTVGWCNKVSPTRRSIMIDEESWQHYPDIRKEQLMFHELGHCALDRPHVEEEDPENLPVSLMYPVMMNDSLYRLHRETYIKELFLCDVDKKKIKNKNITYECGRSVLE
jgi:hypothetical protein